MNLAELFIAINSFFKGMGYSSDNKIYLGSIFFIFILAACVKLPKDKFTLREFIYVLILVLIGLINYFFKHSSVFLLTALTLTLLKNVNIDHCLKIVLISRITGMIALFLALVMGFVHQTTIQTWRIDQFVTRTTINGVHPNILQLNVVIIIILLIYFYRERINWLGYVGLTILNLTFYKYTLSRTGIFIGMLAILLGYLSCYIVLIKKEIMVISKYIYFLLALFSLLIAFFYNDSLSKLNVLFNGRLSYMHMLVTTYPVTLFGENKAYFLNINIDNGFDALLYVCGLLAFLVISYLMISLSFSLFKDKNFYPLFVIFILSIYSLTESFLPNIFVNISIFFLAWKIFEPTENTSDKEKN